MKKRKPKRRSRKKKFQSTFGKAMLKRALGGVNTGVPRGPKTEMMGGIKVYSDTKIPVQHYDGTPTYNK